MPVVLADQGFEVLAIEIPSRKLVDSVSPLTTKKKMVVSLAAIGLIGAIGVVTSRRSSLKNDASSNPSGQNSLDQAIPEGFLLGSMSADEPIEQIKVTIEAGPNAAINEVVDLHLGFGFPLRLGPSGGQDLSPVFAALPTDSSLGADAKSIPAGEPVWFQFDPSDKSSDRDPLQTTHTLLSGLTVGDISQIGFASRGVSDWTLAKYKIEVNGTLYAANGSFKQNLKKASEKYQFEATEMLARDESLGSEVRELKTIVDAGLGSELDEQLLAEKEAELQGLVEPMQRKGRQLLGHLPVVLETESSFQPPVADDRVSSIRVKMLVGGVEQPGTLNPLYLRAGGRKFLLSSEIAPLRDTPSEQVFELTPADMSFDPVSRNDFSDFSIGLLGSNQPLDQIPDRAKLQRVSLEADGESVYDSEPIQSDRLSLDRVALVPPAHRNEQGQIVLNPSDDFERFVWMPGLKIPQTRPVKGQSGIDNAEASNTSSGSGPVSTNVGLRPGDASNNGVGTLGTAAPSSSVPGSSGPGSSGPAGWPGNPATGFPPDTTSPTSHINIATLLGNLIAALNNGSGGVAPTTPGGPGNAGSGNIASSGNSSSNNPQNLSPNNAVPNVFPATKKLQISQVRFGSSYRLLAIPADGSRCSVEWEVENSEEVKEFQVRLWARLPHRRSQVPILIGESERVVNLLASESGVFRSARLPEIDLASTLLSSSEYHRAMVEPEVIAFDSNGNMMSQGGAAKGPMLPLLTKNSQLNQQPFVIGRDPGIQLRRQTTAQSQFQIDGDGFDAPASTIPWNPFASQPTYDGKSAWLTFLPTNSHNALTFESSRVSPVVGISAWDPNIGQLTVRFDNQVKLDANYRLVAHLGIMNGNATTDNQVEIDARLVVQDISGSKGGVREPAEVAGTASAAEVLRIKTTRTVMYDKQGARTPLFLIDIPIALDLGYAAYNTELFETASIGMATLTDMEVDKNFEQSLPIGSIDKALVSLTLMLKMAHPIDNEAIGLFGLRLVQDPVQRPQAQGGTTPQPAQPITGNSGGTLTPEQHAYLNIHNDARTAVGVGPVSWSAELAADAQGYAERLAELDSGLPHRKGNPYGENLAWHTRPGYTAADAAKDGWLSEKINYDSNNGLVVGHYTQMVWDKTERIGYGIAKTKNGKKTYIVGSYDPPGNRSGEKPYPNAP